MARRGLFGSQHLHEQIARGLLGFGTLALAIKIAPLHPGLSIFAGVAMIVAFRGCPLCWTIGLVETIYHRINGGSEEIPL